MFFFNGLSQKSDCLLVGVVMIVEGLVVGSVKSKAILSSDVHSTTSFPSLPLSSSSPIFHVSALYFYFLTAQNKKKTHRVRMRESHTKKSHELMLVIIEKRNLTSQSMNSIPSKEYHHLGHH